MALLLSYEKYCNGFAGLAAGLAAVLPKIARRLPDIVQRRTGRENELLSHCQVFQRMYVATISESLTSKLDNLGIIPCGKQLLFV